MSRFIFQAITTDSHVNEVNSLLCLPEIERVVFSTAFMGAEPPALYPVGCVGRLTSFAETTDGRYLVTLTGICRFRVVEELSVATPYRQVVGDFRPYQDDIKPNPVPPIIDRDKLMSVLNEFMERKGLETDWDSVKEAPSDLLVNSLSMWPPTGSFTGPRSILPKICSKPVLGFFARPAGSFCGSTRPKRVSREKRPR